MIAGTAAANLFLFILPLVLIFAQSKSETASPNWPTDCEFQRYVGKHPEVGRYKYTYGVSSVAECEEMCKADPLCGMYSLSSSSEQSCSQYQFSVNMWKDLGLWGVWDSSHFYTSGSRKCDATIVKSDCNYEYTEGKYPKGTRFGWVDTKASSLTEEMCQDLCSLNSGCKSANYLEDTTSGVRTCYLYDRDLSEEGSRACYSTWSPCGTYEKKCPV